MIDTSVGHVQGENAFQWGTNQIACTSLKDEPSYHTYFIWPQHKAACSVYAEPVTICYQKVFQKSIGAFHKKELINTFLTV